MAGLVALDYQIINVTIADKNLHKKLTLQNKFRLYLCLMSSARHFIVNRKIWSNKM